MIESIEREYSCRILQWAEPVDDCLQFTAIQHGRVIVADSMELLIIALSPPAVYRMAA